MAHRAEPAAHAVFSRSHGQRFESTPCRGSLSCQCCRADVQSARRPGRARVQPDHDRARGNDLLHDQPQRSARDLHRRGFSERKHLYRPCLPEQHRERSGAHVDRRRMERAERGAFPGRRTRRPIAFHRDHVQAAGRRSLRIHRSAKHRCHRSRRQRVLAPGREFFLPAQLDPGTRPNHCSGFVTESVVFCGPLFERNGLRLFRRAAR